MRTKVFYLLCMFFVICSCGGNDSEEQEKPVSAHISEIQSISFYSGVFLGYISDDGQKDVFIGIDGSNDIYLNFVVDSKTMPTIPGRGKIKKVWIDKRRKLKEPANDGTKEERLWRMESVNYGLYAFKGGSVDVQVLDEDRCQMDFIFGPIVDSEGVIENLSISCRCPMTRQGYYR